MSDKKLTVALIYGGKGYEAEVSALGAAYAYELLRERYRIIPVYISKDGRWNVYADGEISPTTCIDFGSLHNLILNKGKSVFPFCFGEGSQFITENGERIPIDVAVPLLHGDFGEDGTVQGTLVSGGIRYVGCDVYTGSLCMDKLYTKLIAASSGVKTAGYVTVRGKTEEDIYEGIDGAEQSLGYPLFVKPIRLGSSVGASRADSRTELERAVRASVATGGGAIIEEYVSASCEAECAYYKAGEKELISDVGGIITGGKFYDYSKKYKDADGMRVSVNLNINAAIREKICNTTARLAKLFCIRHLGRFDYFITDEGDVIFNEINTFPGFTGSSLWPKLISDAGLSPADALSGMIEDALSE